MVQRMEGRWELPNCSRPVGQAGFARGAGYPHPDSPGASPDRVDAVAHVA